MKLKKNGWAQISGAFITQPAHRLSHELTVAAVCFAIGLTSSRATIFGGLAPFGVAAVAAAEKKEALFVLLGAACGTFLPGGPAYPARYLAAMAAALIFHLLSAGLGSHHPIVIPLCASTAAGLTGLALLIANGLQPHDAALYFIEMVICGCSAFFLSKALPLFREPSKLWNLSKRDLINLLISICILLLAFEPLKVYQTSIGQIAGILVILIAANFGGSGAGCAAGASVGLILSLGEPNTAPLLAGFAFGGLIAGFFSPLGRFGNVMAFFCADLAAGINLGANTNMLPITIASACSSILFLLIPETLLCRASILFISLRERRSTRSSEEVRLSQAAVALRNASQTISNVGDRLATIQQENPFDCLCSDASRYTCAHCGMRHYCWETASKDTKDALRSLTNTLLQTGIINRQDVPSHFTGRCCQLGDLLSVLNRSYAEFAARSAAQRQIWELRRMLSGQWDILASFLDELSGKARIQETDLSSDPVRSALAVCGLSAAQAACRLDDKGRMSVEARLESIPQTAINQTELTAELSAACGRNLEGPFMTRASGNTVLRFRQKPTFRISYGQTSLCKDGERLCGDAASVCQLNGQALLLLSDGMGTGGAAAVNAGVTLDIAVKLLQAGFGTKAALQAINSALMLKADESFSTLDLAQIDLYTGETDLFKAGAPPTYLRRHGHTDRISPRSLPLGIVSDINASHTKLHLSCDDLLVIVSDGAIAEDDAWLIHYITESADDSMDIFSKHLAEAAKERRSDGHEDDITVLAARLEHA